ncbi:MAG: 2-C-methyl-D-erythritol 4-phosphate cytidylyltransferase [Nitrospirales bacterium]|nr:2-C-methyl-D-erythritol 4-phosphate cytidylyltransferase [Nitrospirales bacterium]
MSDLVVAVVPAAGQGARMGRHTPKQYLTLGEVPILVYCLKVFQQVSDIDSIVLSVPESDRDFCRHDIVLAHHLTKVSCIVAGGRRRQDSVRHGIMSLTTPPALILVHDGVRPFIDERMVREVIQAARRTGAAVAAMPLHDTVKRVGPDHLIRETLNREELWQTQTPQAFQFDWLVEGHRLAQEQGWEVTDDAAIIERLGYPVSVVEGSCFNIKITRPEDLVLGEAIRQASTKQGLL